MTKAWPQDSATFFASDLGNLKKIISATVSSDPIRLEQVEVVKSARLAALKKKGTFQEALQFFPLGQYIQQSCNGLLEAFFRDRGFVADLESIVQSCAGMKTFTLELLLKADALDISIPGQAKVVEVAQRFAMTQLNSTVHFQAQNVTGLKLVKAKIEELAAALMSATISKFSRRHRDGLKQGLEGLVQGSLAADATATFIQVLNDAKAFVPMNVQTIQKCLGAADSKEILDMLSRVKLIWTGIIVGLPKATALLAKDSEVTSGRLLEDGLVDLMRNAQSPNMSALKQLSPEISELFESLATKIAERAMRTVCTRRFSVEV